MRFQGSNRFWGRLEVGRACKSQRGSYEPSRRLAKQTPARTLQQQIALPPLHPLIPARPSLFPKMISTVAFLRRGIAAENPTVFKMTDEEYAKMKELAGEQVDFAREELEAAEAAAAMDEDGEEEEEEEEEEDEEESGDEVAKAKRAAKRIKAEQAVAVAAAAAASASAHKKKHSGDPSDLSAFDLDTYDADGKDSEGEQDPTARLFSNIGTLSVPPEADPYLTLGDDENDSDEEDLRVLPTDNLIIAARTEDDVSQVEVYVYERGEANLYVRNDWMVPGMPLCMEWLDFGPGGEKGGLTLGFLSSPYSYLTNSFPHFS